MVAGVRTAYFDAARAAVEVLTGPEVGRRWPDPSVLPGMSVAALAAHLARSVLQVEWFLDAAPAAGPLVTAVTYYARLRGTTVPDSTLNTGVRARSQQTAEQGRDVVVEQARRALERLDARLPLEPAERRVTILHHDDEAMLLDEYLATRCVELAVHLEDLALSVGHGTRTPAGAAAVAIDVLVGAARERHGDVEVLHALARRERDAEDALRVL